MNIKIQKILSFIPLVNLIPIFCGVAPYLSFDANNKKRLLFVFRVAGAFLAINIAGILLSLIDDGSVFQAIIMYVRAYLSLLVIARISINDQEKNINEKVS